MACRFLCCRFRAENRWGLDAIAKGYGSGHLPDGASIRPSWPGCWPWNGSRVASSWSPSWISRTRRPVRSAAVVRADPLELVAPSLPAPREVPPSWGRLLALGGLEPNGGFLLALEDWGEFGLSRFSASRGLDELERAEMVSVGRMQVGLRSLQS